MALTRNFKITVMDRARRDKKFCKVMLAGAIEELLSGDVNVGKAILRDYINATITFELLSKRMEKNPKSLMRMLSSNGNPTSSSLFEIFHVIQKVSKIQYKITIS